MAKIEAELRQQIHQTLGEAQGVGSSLQNEAQEFQSGKANLQELSFEKASVHPSTGPVATQSYGAANQYPHLPFGIDRAPQDNAQQQQPQMQSTPQVQTPVFPSVAQLSAVQAVAPGSATHLAPLVTQSTGPMITPGVKASFVTVPGSVPPQVVMAEQAVPGMLPQQQVAFAQQPHPASNMLPQQPPAPGLMLPQFSVAEQADGTGTSTHKSFLRARSSIAQEGGLPVFPGA